MCAKIYSVLTYNNLRFSNTVQFESSGSRPLRPCFGYAADQTPCKARKIWEFEDPSHSADEYVNSVLKENKHMKPVQIPNHTITKIIEDVWDWNEIINKAREFTDVEWLSKRKSAMKKNINPH